MTDRTERDAEVFREYLSFGNLVDGGEVTPSWILGGPTFWFADGGPQDRRLSLVDPARNTREPLFDVDRLRERLTDALGYEPAGRGVPFARVDFTGPRTVTFDLDGATWTMDLDSYALHRLPAVDSVDRFELFPSEGSRATPRSYFKEAFLAMGRIGVPERRSPDGRWYASTVDNNVVLRAAVDGQTVALTDDGTDSVLWDVETVRWQPWSPDGRRLVATRSDTTGMVKVPTIHWLQPIEQATEVFAIPAGAVINRDELYVLDVHRGRPVRVDLGDTTDEYLVVLGWRPDGGEVIVARYDRRFVGVEILAANPVNGRTRTVLTEASDTWLTNHHFVLWGTDTGFWMLPDGSGFLWRSERDGWAHLYHYDFAGRMVGRLTDGDFPVTEVKHIDQAGGWVYYQAHGDPDRPYDNHLYRVPLAGGAPTRLTDGAGRHTINMAPSGDCFVDTFSSVDTPPRTVLRRADGTELQTLGEAAIDRLLRVGWTPAQEHVVRAADGVTDLWVTLHLPWDFDPTRKYPVVEHIYAGAQVMMRPMDFGVRPSLGRTAEVANFPRALAQHGFVVVTLDGRGTPGRSKAFHDTIYRNWGGFEVADHAGAIRQLAERLGFLDLDRVAVTGRSWGGHYAFRALVDEPDLYRYGITESPGYDPHAFTLYEVYLGMPADNADLYDRADLFGRAPELRAKLLQVCGVNDTGTQRDAFRMSETLIRLGIQHDTMTYPNTGHAINGAAGRYNTALQRDWLIRHLSP